MHAVRLITISKTTFINDANIFIIKKLRLNREKNSDKSQYEVAFISSATFDVNENFHQMITFKRHPLRT